MRSRKTTNILLVLAFLFILTIIILCLLPTEKKPGQKPQYEEHGQDEPEKTTKTTSSKATTSSTFSTAETTESTLTTIGTTTEKHLPPSNESEETISSTATEVSIPTTTVKEHHTSTSETPSAKTTTSTSDSTTAVKLTTVPNTAYATSEQSTDNETYTTSTAETTESTLTTIRTTTEKHLPPSNESEETISSTSTEVSIPTTTVKEHHTSTSETPSAKTTTSTSDSTTTTVKLTTVPNTAYATSEQSTHNETYTTSFESTSQTTLDPYMNATADNTSIPSITTTAKTPAQTAPTTSSTTATATTILPSTPYSESEEVCTSDGCKEVSAKMLDSLNHEIDPCENFHEYSCGGLQNDQFLRPESAEENLDHILKEELVSHNTEALRFYDSCLSYLDGTGEEEEGMRHEGLFPTHWKIHSPPSLFEEGEVTSGPSQNLTRTLTSLISRDLPVLFDVTAEVRKVKGSIKILPKLRLSLLDDFESNYDHKYCIDRFRRRMRNNRHGEGKKILGGLSLRRNRKGWRPEGADKDKPLYETPKGQNQRVNPTVEEEILKVDIEHKYNSYLQCMSGDGLKFRAKRVEALLVEWDVFAPRLSTPDKKSLVRKILTDLNEIIFSDSNIAGGETSFNITTLSYIDGHTVLGGLIKWGDVLSDLFGYPVPLDQQIIIENVSKFSSIFSHFKNNWIDKNIENLAVMLAAEKLLRIKGEDRDFKKDFCFGLTKKYLPLHMQLLFTKTFSPAELDALISEVSNLGWSVFVEIESNFELPTYVEFIDNQTLMSNLQHFNTQIKLTDDFLSNLPLLQTHYRKNMYRITGTDLKDPESCRFLPRDLSGRCNLFAAERIIVPLEYLVAPNFIFRKDVPNYLRLAGIANYITQIIVFSLGTNELNVKGYQGNDCLIQNIPSAFEEKIKNFKVEYTVNANKEVKSRTLLQFEAFNIAWRVIKHLPQLNNDSLEETETKENPLIWQGADALSPLKAFLIRKAQESCREDNHFDLLRISLFKQPPNYFWINTLMKIDNFFGSAWHCPLNSSMAQSRECLPEATTATTTPHSTSLSREYINNPMYN